MKTAILALLGLAGTAVIAVLIVAIMGVSFYNQEVTLRKTIEAKQTDNKNQMDAMWKIIDQNAQVTEIQKNNLMEIFNGYASARTGANGSASLMKWVQEAIPNVDQSTFNNLMNTITAQRDSFKQRQTELLDLNREHDVLISRFPNVLFAGIVGAKHIDITIVTSSRTENAFQTGKDDDVKLPGTK
jgi:hypothetical protein